MYVAKYAFRMNNNVFNGLKRAKQWHKFDLLNWKPVYLMRINQITTLMSVLWTQKSAVPFRHYLVDTKHFHRKP